MLQNNTLEMVDHQGLGYYSQLSNAKSTGGWCIFESEQLHRPYQVQDGDSLFGVRIDQEGGLHALDRL